MKCLDCVFEKTGASAARRLAKSNGATKTEGAGVRIQRKRSNKAQGNVGIGKEEFTK